MADLGPIGVDTNLTLSGYSGWGLKSLVIGGDYAALGGRDNAEGFSSQPSLRLDARGVYSFLWAMTAGARALSISVKQAANADPRPSVVIRANPEIGINADITTVAGSGTGWVTIGPIAVNPAQAGCVRVELRNNYNAMIFTAPCYWDNLQRT